MLGRSPDYFSYFLKEIQCTNIEFVDLDYQTQAIGFDCPSRKFVDALLKQLNLQAMVQEENGHFILTITNAQIIRLMRQHLELVLERFRKQENNYLGAGHYTDDSFVFAFRGDYENLKRNPELLERVRALGLDYGENQYTQYHFIPALIPFPGPNYYLLPHIPLEPEIIWTHYLVIPEMDRFFAQHGKSLAEQAYRKVSAEAFSMGLHPIVGKESSIRSMKTSGLFESKLIPELFSYVDFQPVTETKRMPERKKDTAIPVIDAALAVIDKEIKSSWYWFNMDRKYHKAAFFKSIQRIKKANPALTAKACVEFAEKQNPKLFQSAMEGYFSTRTRTVIEALKRTTPGI